jgi:hypothetical protein
MRLPKFGLHHPYPDRQSAEQAAHILTEAFIPHGWGYTVEQDQRGWMVWPDKPLGLFQFLFARIGIWIKGEGQIFKSH